ncbi:MAG: succinate dehydrogenase/fumarate reductase iron-sulfur subunit [Fidelibacterota bacterium]
MANKIPLEVLRYRPEQEKEPTFDTYEVSFREDWVILDALNYIKDELDGSLSYRWSCRMGVCGSCGMMVNGVPVLTCGAFIRDYAPGPVRVEPLTGFPVERDLVVVMDDFMDKLNAVKPWIIREEEKSLDEGEYLQSPGELERYRQYSMCINCMLCYAACPVYALDSTFIGPAAIALAQRYNLDSRDLGKKERHEAVTGHEGIWECSYVGECSAVCPKDVDPAAAIQRAKLPSSLSFMKEVLLPWGRKR